MLFFSTKDQDFRRILGIIAFFLNQGSGFQGFQGSWRVKIESRFFSFLRIRTLAIAFLIVTSAHSISKFMWLFYKCVEAMGTIKQISYSRVPYDRSIKVRLNVKNVFLFSIYIFSSNEKYLFFKKQNPITKSVGFICSYKYSTFYKKVVDLANRENMCSC